MRRWFICLLLLSAVLSLSHIYVQSMAERNCVALQIDTRFPTHTHRQTVSHITTNRFQCATKDPFLQCTRDTLFVFNIRLVLKPNTKLNCYNCRNLIFSLSHWISILANDIVANSVVVSGQILHSISPCNGIFVMTGLRWTKTNVQHRPDIKRNQPFIFRFVVYFVHHKHATTSRYVLGDLTLHYYAPNVIICKALAFVPIQLEKKKQREYYVCVCVWARNRVPFEWTNHHHHSFNLPITNRTNSLMKTMNIKTTIQRNKPNTLWSPDWFNGFNWLEMLQLTVAENFNFDNHFFVVVFLIS